MGWQDAPVVGGTQPAWASAPKVGAPDVSQIPAADAPVPWSGLKGLAQGLRDPIDAGAQMLEHGLQSAGVDTGAINRALGMPSAAETMQQGQDFYRGGNQLARAAGNLVATLPVAAIPGGQGMAARIGIGAATGAGLGALQPVDNALTGDFWTEKAKQAGIGAAVGGVAAPVVAGLSRVVQPQTAPAVKNLLASGIDLTPGQIAGGMFKRAEEGARSLPIVGDAIIAAQQRGNASFNKATINQALDKIGATLPENMPAGYKAVEFAHGIVSDAYNALLPKLRVAQDATFQKDIGNVIDMAQNLAPDSIKQFDNIVTNEVLNKFTPAGLMSGETMKGVDTQLGYLIRKFKGSQNPNDQMLGDALREVQGNVRGMVERGNPQYAGEISKINSAFAQMVRVENAAGRIGAKEGVFTPNQYEGAVRATDTSARKKQFAQGNALGQNFATDAQSVMANRLPDSGTPYRGMLALLGGGVGVMNPMVGIGMGAGALAYTPTVQNLLTAAMTRRPAAAEPIANALARLSAPITAGVLPFLPGAAQARQ